MQNLKLKLQEIFGEKGAGVKCARAPGRVNLIGEHTDYNGGFVLPMAVDREVCLMFRPVNNGKIRLWSEDYSVMDEFAIDNVRPVKENKWANYVRGVAWSLQKNGMPVRPLEGVLQGNVPIGAGLSSSAALEVSAALALCPEEAVKNIDGKKLAQVCRQAENDFVGVNCGIMDQFVSVNAQKNNAVLIDCRSLEYELLPLDNDDLTIVVANTMVEHELGASAYNKRRSTCESAAKKINDKFGGVGELRDVDAQMLPELDDILTPLEYWRTIHVVQENRRVKQAVKALKGRKYRRFGLLMIDSHKSLRDYYEVSCPELDAMVDLALACEGVYGARMTGAGFGGCTVNLVDSQKCDEVIEKLYARYERDTGIKPDIFKFKAEKGAEVFEF